MPARTNPHPDTPLSPCQRGLVKQPDWFDASARLLAVHLGGPVLLLDWDSWEKEGKALAELERWNELSKT